MTLAPDRVWLDHTTLMSMERRVEQMNGLIEDLTREVDGIDFEPSYTCDCSCDGEINDMHNLIDAQQDVIDLLIKRIEGMEAKLAMQH